VRLHDRAPGELIPATMWRELTRSKIWRADCRGFADGGEGPLAGPSALLRDYSRREAAPPQN
jgi:hypothetical protein